MVLKSNTEGEAWKAALNSRNKWPHNVSPPRQDIRGLLYCTKPTINLFSELRVIDRDIVYFRN